MNNITKQPEITPVICASRAHGKAKLLTTALLGIALVAHAALGACVNVNRVQVLIDGTSANFELHWDDQPDFLTTDNSSVPNQAVSFQFFINYTTNRSHWENITDPNVTIIRGEEIHLPANRTLIPIRNSLDPNTGLWGSVRGSVPFTLSNKTLTFTVPLALINGDPTGFTYYLEWYSYGSGCGHTYYWTASTAHKGANTIKMKPDRARPQSSGAPTD